MYAWATNQSFPVKLTPAQVAAAKEAQATAQVAAQLAAQKAQAAAQAAAQLAAQKAQAAAQAQAAARAKAFTMPPVTASVCMGYYPGFYQSLNQAGAYGPYVTNDVNGVVGYTDVCVGGPYDGRRVED